MLKETNKHTPARSLKFKSRAMYRALADLSQGHAAAVAVVAGDHRRLP